MMKRSRQRVWYLAGVYGPALAKYLFPNLIWKVEKKLKEIEDTREWNRRGEKVSDHVGII